MIPLKHKFAYGFFAVACVVGPYGLWLGHSISPMNSNDDPPAAEASTMPPPASRSVPYPPSPVPKEKSTFIGIGDTAQVASGEGMAQISIDRQALTDLVKAAAAKDNVGYRAVISSGRAFQVPDGTKVKVIALGGLFYDQYKQVRVIGGSHDGEAGWVPSELVKPS